MGTLFLHDAIDGGTLTRESYSWNHMKSIGTLIF